MRASPIPRSRTRSNRSASFTPASAMARKASLRSASVVSPASPISPQKTCPRTTPGGRAGDAAAPQRRHVVIIVFGGTGMLGQHTAQALIDKGETVVVTGVRRQDPVLLKEAVSRKQAIVEHLDLSDPFAVM